MCRPISAVLLRASRPPASALLESLPTLTCDQAPSKRDSRSNGEPSWINGVVKQKNGQTPCDCQPNGHSKKKDCPSFHNTAFQSPRLPAERLNRELTGRVMSLSAQPSP